MLKRARPRYVVPFAWAVRRDGATLWDMLRERWTALQGGIPRGITTGPPNARPRGMVTPGTHRDAGGGDGDRDSAGDENDGTYDWSLGMGSAADHSVQDSAEGDVSTGVDNALVQTTSKEDAEGTAGITSPARRHFWLDPA